MTIKKIFIGIFLLTALMWLSGELLLKSDERALEQMSVSTTTSEVAGVSTTSLGTTPLPKKEAQLPVTTRASSSVVVVPVVPPSSVVSEEGKEMISATLSIDGKSFTHQLPKGANVGALLVSAQSVGEISFQGKEYSGLGMLVVGINGKENNNDKNNLYWIYSVNGKKATVGVSQYVLSSGDVVSWSYEQNTY